MGKATRDALARPCAKPGRSIRHCVVDGEREQLNAHEWFAQEFPEPALSTWDWERPGGYRAGLAACGKLRYCQGASLSVQRATTNLRMSIAFPIQVKVVWQPCPASALRGAGPVARCNRGRGPGAGTATFTCRPADEPSTHKAVTAMQGGGWPGLYARGPAGRAAVYAKTLTSVGEANETAQRQASADRQWHHGAAGAGSGRKRSRRRGVRPVCSIAHVRPGRRCVTRAAARPRQDRGCPRNFGQGGLEPAGGQWPPAESTFSSLRDGGCVGV